MKKATKFLLSVCSVVVLAFLLLFSGLLEKVGLLGRRTGDSSVKDYSLSLFMPDSAQADYSYEGGTVGEGPAGSPGGPCPAVLILKDEEFLD